MFAPLERQLNFQQNSCNISHLTLALVPHYLEKSKKKIIYWRSAKENNNNTRKNCPL